MTELRADLQIIADLVPAAATALEIGCADGELLAWLAKHKQVDGRGMELSQTQVNQCVAKGLAVVQGDANLDLQYYPDEAFDVVVLSRTLQTLDAPHEVLKQLARIGNQVILSVPNFGQWKNRLHLVLHGRMPVTKALTYQWYDTPNIHFCTLRDFVILCQELDIVIEKRVMVGGGLFPNLTAEQGVFVIRGKDAV
jgi:methionine biosynthesis protein MetW